MDDNNNKKSMVIEIYKNLFTAPKITKAKKK